MIVRVYHRRLSVTPNGWRSVSEHMTDHVVQDYAHARRVQLEAERQRAVSGANWLLFALYEY